MSPSTPTSTRSPGSDRELFSEWEIHIWSGSMERTPVEPLIRLMVPDELRQAEQYQFDRDRRRFIVRRAMLRMVVARYFHADPAALRFTNNPHAKPQVMGEFADRGLTFSATSSQECAVIAIAFQQRVGVDVEFVQPLPDLENLARRCLSTGERSELFSRPPSDRLRCFYTYWTSKESCLKATGEGLLRPLDSVSFTRPPTIDKESIGNLTGADGSDSLFVWNYRPSPGYLAAVAYERRSTDVKTFTFHD